MVSSMKMEETPRCQKISCFLQCKQLYLEYVLGRLL
jgi:hypothetical protein